VSADFSVTNEGSSFAVISIITVGTVGVMVFTFFYLLTLTLWPLRHIVKLLLASCLARCARRRNKRAAVFPADLIHAAHDEDKGSERAEPAPAERGPPSAASLLVHGTPTSSHHVGPIAHRSHRAAVLMSRSSSGEGASTSTDGARYAAGSRPGSRPPGPVAVTVATSPGEIPHSIREDPPLQAEALRPAPAHSSAPSPKPDVSLSSASAYDEGPSSHRPRAGTTQMEGLIE
jgi:hypothetical protein